MKNILVVIGLLSSMYSLKAVASSWSGKYTPTKLEWLEVELNSLYRSHCHRSSPADYCVGITYIGESPNSIIIQIDARGAVPLAEYDAEVSTAKKLITASAHRYGLGPPKIQIIKSISP
jgi:hypothetical protein